MIRTHPGDFRQAFTGVVFLVILNYKIPDGLDFNTCLVCHQLFVSTLPQVGQRHLHGVDLIRQAQGEDNEKRRTLDMNVINQLVRDDIKTGQKPFHLREVVHENSDQQEHPGPIPRPSHFYRGK